MNSSTIIHHSTHAYSTISTMAVQQHATFKWSYVRGRQSDSLEILHNSSSSNVSRQDLEVQYNQHDYMLMIILMQMQTQMQNKHSFGSLRCFSGY